MMSPLTQFSLVKASNLYLLRQSIKVMLRIVKRHRLKGRDTKLFLAELRDALGIDLEELLGERPQIELLKTRDCEIFLLNGKTALLRIEDGRIAPTLLFGKYLSLLPKVVVDMGAIPHICNGADVMAPGVLRVEGKFSVGDLVLIVDERYEKPVAIGSALIDSEAVNSTKRGKVVKNLHYIGDKIWSLLRKIVKG
ncbi:hypothetical protein DRO29_01115 [Candidatus Bathyarchaeota archaeon]|nr:MAG: hypothetical protein DRO29_01115 [Candidatus Bathyarchaeota archaeon]